MSEMYQANLAKAIVKAQKNAQAVEKTSANGFHRYKYASAESVIAEARMALSSADLALITLDVALDSNLLQVSYQLIHESGEAASFKSVTPVIEEKGRPLDKAVATALTYNLSYFLRGLLLLPRVEEGQEVKVGGNDHDVDQRDDRTHRPLTADELEKHLVTISDEDSLKKWGAFVKKATLSVEDKLRLTEKYKAKRDTLAKEVA